MSRCFPILLPVFLAGSALHAQSVWTGGGSDDNWSTGANWQGGTAPASGSGTALQFAGTTRLTPNTDSAFTLGSLTFNSGAGAFTLGGSALTLANGATVTNNSTSLQTIANTGGISLGFIGDSTWNTASGDITVSSAVSGGHDLHKTGGGTLTIANTATGPNSTQVHNGTLFVANGGAYDGAQIGVGWNPGDNGTLTVSSGASVSVSGSGSNLIAGLSSGATGVINVAGTVQMGGLSLGEGGTGTLHLTAGSLTSLGNGDYIGGYGGSGTMNVSGGTYNNNSTFFVGGFSSGTGTLNVTGGTLNTRAYDTDQSTYLGYDTGATGTATVSGGTWNTAYVLNVGNGGTGTLTISGAGSVNVDDGAGHAGFVYLGQGIAPATLNLGAGGAAGTLIAAQVFGRGLATVNFNHTGSLTFAPQLAGDLSVIKSGAGTTTLTAVNTYTGATTINAGTLLVDGSLTQSAVTVNSGGTLGGSGTLGATATIASGGHLAPGDSPGTVTFTNGLTLAAGSALDFQLGASSDLIRVSGGTLTGPSSGLVTLNFSDAGGFAAGSYALFDFTDAGTSSFDLDDFTFGAKISGYDYALTIEGTTLELTATASPIPEPSALAAIVGALALGAAILRKQHGFRQRRLGTAVN